MAETSYPRITGTEMEWCIFVQEQEDYAHFVQPEKLVSGVQLAQHLPAGLRSMNEFLSNGARYYQDVGSHVEYATPENISFRKTVVSELAGEKIVAATLDSLQAEGTIFKYKLHKRLVDDAGVTWGHHENYLASSSEINISEERLSLLGLHLATRNIWAGAGYIEKQADILKFNVAQKINSLNLEYSNSSVTSYKPLVNLRNQPLADAELFVRVHVTSGDANVSPWAMWMTLGTTSIVLRLIENGQFIETISMAEKPGVLSIAKLVSQDSEMKQRFMLDDGKVVSAHDVQSKLVTLARQHEQRYGLPDEEVEILNEWEQVLDDLSVDPLRTTDRIEWIGRKQLLDTYCERKGWDADHPDLLLIDKLWDECSSRGLAMQRRDTLWKKWMPDPEEIETAVNEPPDDTRAIIRGAFVKQHAGRSDCSVIDWAVLKTGQNSVSLSNPYQFSSEAAA